MNIWICPSPTPPPRCTPRLISFIRVIRGLEGSQRRGSTVRHGGGTVTIQLASPVFATHLLMTCITSFCWRSTEVKWWHPRGRTPPTRRLAEGSRRLMGWVGVGATIFPFPPARRVGVSVVAAEKNCFDFRRHKRSFRRRRLDSPWMRLAVSSAHVIIYIAAAAGLRHNPSFLRLDLCGSSLRLAPACFSLFFFFLWYPD